MSVKEISKETAQGIISNRKPLGLFYFIVKGVYVGIDNSKGDSFVEAFQNKNICIYWLTNENFSYLTEEDYGKSIDELKQENKVIK